MNENNEELVYEIKFNKKVIFLMAVVILLIGSLALNFKYIIDEKNKQKQELKLTIAENYIKEYNEQFEKQFGREISGEKVIQLLNDVIINNTNSSINSIGIDTFYTAPNGKRLMGQNNIDPKYIEDMIIPTIIKDKKYIVRVTSNNVAYSEIGFIQRISIADKSDLQDEEVYRFNNDYKRYINKTIDGSTVKELIKKIKEYDEEQYKNNTKKYIRILFDLSEEYTNNNQKCNLLTGVGDIFFSEGDYLEEYFDLPVDNKQYYVNVNKFNPDGTISEIVISSDINKYK